MNKQIKSMSKERLIANNYEQTQKQTSAQQANDYLVLPEITSAQISDDSSAIAERLKKLQSNLRILQRQYRANLKQGFDNKIKAYRLQAVVERKLLKEAIYSISKRKEHQAIQGKKRDAQSNSLHDSRIQLMKADRQNRQKLFKKKQFEQKKSFSLSLNQARLESEQAIKVIHDKIAKQGEKVNRKKDFLYFVRKESIKKEQQETKRQLLKKIITNTDRLKDLKMVLQSLKGHQLMGEKTFLTI